MRALDASFLSAETPRTPLHVGALAIFEGGPFFDASGAFRIDAVRARITERLHLFPRLRMRPEASPTDTDACPDAGVLAELLRENFDALLALAPLDRARPQLERKA